MKRDTLKPRHRPLYVGDIVGPKLVTYEEFERALHEVLDLVNGGGIIAEYMAKNLCSCGGLRSEVAVLGVALARASDRLNEIWPSEPLDDEAA